MKNKRLIVAAILIIAGLILNFCFTGMGFIAYTMYFAAALTLIFGVAGRALKRVICVFLALGLVYFIVVEAFIIGSSSGDSNADYNYVIVLGAAVNGNTPSLALVERMDAARSYLLEHPDSVAILSGGRGGGENISEAEAMYNWLTAKGIDGSRLILEDKAESTYENLKYSFDIIRQRGQEPGASTAVVTSEYHVYRAKLLAESLGADVGGVAADTTRFPIKLNYFIREAFGVTYQWIFG